MVVLFALENDLLKLKKAILPSKEFSVMLKTYILCHTPPLLYQIQFQIQPLYSVYADKSYKGQFIFYKQGAYTFTCRDLPFNRAKSLQYYETNF